VQAKKVELKAASHGQPSERMSDGVEIILVLVLKK
jgi:hypothetical protein